MIKIEQNKSLKPFNTFGVTSCAKFFAEVHSPEEVRELLTLTKLSPVRKLVLGGGSNLLLTGDFDGLVIKNSIPGIQVTDETKTSVTVRAGAGDLWHTFVQWCLKQNFAGLENLSLIPGQVGAAPVQNIGAYGVELKDVFHKLEAVEISSGRLKTFKLKDCRFGYRQSVFNQELKDRFIITHVFLKLTRQNERSRYRPRLDYGNLKAMLGQASIDKPTIHDISEAVCQIRRSKLPDPKEVGNAGSFFKNPLITQAQMKQIVRRYPSMPHFAEPNGFFKIPAAWLIEQCGWKGKVVGHAGVHKHQAVVLVNYSSATGKEILQLATRIRGSVKRKFGINLSIEVNVV